MGGCAFPAVLASGGPTSSSFGGGGLSICTNWGDWHDIDIVGFASRSGSALWDSRK